MTGNKRRTARRINYDPCYCGRIMEYTDDETAPQFCSATCRASFREGYVQGMRNAPLVALPSRASFREGYVQGMRDVRLGSARVRLDRLDTAIHNDS